MKIRGLLNNFLLIDIIHALIVGLKCAYKQPVTRNLKDISYSKNAKRCFYIDNEKCIACRNCASVCPTKSIKIIDKKSYIHNKNTCSLCCLCSSACPKKAIRFERN